AVHRRDRLLHRGHLFDRLRAVREIAGDHKSGGRFTRGRIRSMRLLEVDLDVQTSLCFLEQLLDTRGSRLAVEVSETNAFGMLGDVLPAGEVGLEAGGAEDSAGVKNATIQLPIQN